MLSIIIPSRQELYLQRTIDDILAKAHGEIEVIPVLDGYWPDPPLKDDKRVIVIHRSRRGMRESINNGVSVARGKHIMKCDAHCLFAPGFDTVLTETLEDNWIVVPRRYSLDSETWNVRWHRPFVDYEYFGNPYNKRLMTNGRIGLHGFVWDERIAERCDKLFDENMVFQGSCWVMYKDHWVKRIGDMDSEKYGTFSSEAAEIGLKTWLGGGKIYTNKRAWYAHLWKGKPYREKFRQIFGVEHTRQGFNEQKRGCSYSIDFWLNDRWPERVHDFSWLLERFWPVPSWSEDRSTWKPQ